MCLGQNQSSGGRLPLSPSHTPKQAGNIRATCRGIVDRAIANPSAHKRMTGMCILALDTRFGPRYDVTDLLVLTRIRQKVSAGKSVAGTISPPRQHTLCSPKICYTQYGHRKLASSCSHAFGTCTERMTRILLIALKPRVYRRKSCPTRKKNSNSDGSKWPSRMVGLRDGVSLLLAERARRNGRSQDSMD